MKHFGGWGGGEASCIMGDVQMADSYIKGWEE